MPQSEESDIFYGLPFLQTQQSAVQGLLGSAALAAPKWRPVLWRHSSIKRQEWMHNLRRRGLFTASASLERRRHSEVRRGRTKGIHCESDGGRSTHIAAGLLDYFDGGLLILWLKRQGSQMTKNYYTFSFNTHQTCFLLNHPPMQQPRDTRPSSYSAW
jgi:hypothetical protein